MTQSKHIAIVSPMNPVVSDIGNGELLSDIKMSVDGAALEGITSINVKAGTNGFTNVTVDMPADAIMKLNAAFFVRITKDKNNLEDLVSSLMSQAICDTIPATSELNHDNHLQGLLAVRFMELIVERTTGVDT